MSESGPANSTTDRWGNRTYTWRDEEFPSATTILKGVPKEALVGWAASETAKRAIADVKDGTLQRLVEKDEEGARKYLTQARFTKRDKAADAGSLIHRAVEAHILGAEPPVVPIELRPQMETFHRFEAEYQPQWEASEVTVYNRTDGWAGTLDAIAVINGSRYLLDVKTGKGVYPEYALQLNAYARGEFVGLPDGSEHPLPELDGALIFHLLPRSYNLVPVRLDDELYAAFLTAKKMREWLRVTSKTALGDAWVNQAMAEEAIRVFGDNNSGEAA